MDACIVKANPTDLQMCQLLTKRHTLRRRIDKWRDIQDVYMPSVAEHRAESISPDDANGSYPETVPLHLPSSLPADVIRTIPSNFIDIETRLRISQADDSLDDLKKFLRVTMGLWDYKRRNIGPSQRSSTRMFTTIDAFKEKVNRCADRYRAARRALSILDPGGSWAIRLRELNPEDIKPPTRDMERVPKANRARGVSSTARSDQDHSEGRRTLTWIWSAARPTNTESHGENVQAEIDESRFEICSHY